MVSREQERIAKIVLDAAFEVLFYLGPGLLESTYQTCLLRELLKKKSPQSRIEPKVRSRISKKKKYLSLPSLTFSTSSTLR
jgi:hypothetical protein